jgi:hypothetical protein
MNGQFDLVVSETRSAALRVLSLIGRCQDLTDGKRYLDPPVIFWGSRMNGESLRRQRHPVWPSHLHLFGGYAPFPVSQAELGPFRLSQLDRSHNDQRSQLQRIPRHGVLAGFT